MSLGHWEITNSSNTKDRSTYEVLHLPALSHPPEYIEVSCSLWSSQADVAWHYWSLGLLSFAVNLFCCLWKRERQGCCYYLIELKCSVLVSFHLLFTGTGTGRGTFTPDAFSHFQPLKLSACLCQTWGAQGCAVGSLEYQRNANGCNSWITMCTCTCLFRNPSIN